MTITFYPKPGHVLVCDFQTGFIPPEMVKRRRVIVVSPARLNSHLCRVVPINTTPPEIELAHHCRFEAASYPFLSADLPCWAKADMITAVSLQRLDRLNIRGQYFTPSISNQDYQRLMMAVLSGLSHNVG